MTALLSPKLWLALAFAALLAVIGLQQLRVSREKERFANYRATTEQNIRLASERARAEESRMQTNVDQEVKNAQPAIQAEQRDAAVVRADSRGVRDTAARVIYRACPVAKPAAASAPAGDPIGVFADVLGRIDARAGRLAEIAGERGAAGTLCERYADGLQPAQGKAYP